MAFLIRNKEVPICLAFDLFFSNVFMYRAHYLVSKALNLVRAKNQIPVPWANASEVYYFIYILQGGLQ